MWQVAGLKIKKSGVRVSLLIMCRSVKQLLILYCLCLPRSDGYLVDENFDQLPVYLCDVCAEFSQGR